MAQAGGFIPGSWLERLNPNVLLPWGLSDMMVYAEPIGLDLHFADIEDQPAKRLQDFLSGPGALA
ncbi:MAG: hypothetical protein P8X55_07920, partial [Desulfosarcinaceae bacterium]